MPRTIRNPKLDTRSARSKLLMRREPYWATVSAGCHLGYRRHGEGGSWIAKFRPASESHAEDGKRRIAALGAADDARDADGLSVLSFSQAQERARAWFERMAREQAGDLAPSNGPYTVADALADYRADYLRRGGKAIDRLDYQIKAWIEPELGTIALARLTKRRVEAWHVRVAETPARLRTKPGEEQNYREIDGAESMRQRRSTANRVLTILKAALNHAHQEGHADSDAAWRMVKAFREADAARLRYLSDVESRRLVNACQPDFRALVTAALLTGCRYGELAALTAGDFNRDSGTVGVRQSKSGKPRHVVLTPEGVDFLATLANGKPAGARLLLRGNGKPWSKSEQARPLAAACEAARIDSPANFHALRHTYASRLAMKGVPLAVIAAQLGHVDTRMVEKHYGHLAPSYIADTVRAAFGHLGIIAPSNVVAIG